MSSTTTNSTARDEVEQFLQNHPGWWETNPIATHTGYSPNHIRQTATAMAENNTSSVERRKNQSKPVVAYIFGGDWEIPGSDRRNYIRLIEMYANHPPSNLHTLSLSTLQDKLRNLADDTKIAEYKVEFRIR